MNKTKKASHSGRVWLLIQESVSKARRRGLFLAKLTLSLKRESTQLVFRASSNVLPLCGIMCRGRAFEIRFVNKLFTHSKAVEEIVRQHSLTQKIRLDKVINIKITKIDKINKTSLQTHFFEI